MKIGFNDIWEFLDYTSRSKTNWHFCLKAGDISISGLRYKTLASLKNDKNFDPELIYSLFIYREIIWQPNVFVSTDRSITPLKVFQAYCEEQVAYKSMHPLCRELIKGLVIHTKRAISRLEQNGNGSTVRVLGEFRRHVFPIVLFFIMHPRNRPDYQHDAWNRLNYCVKVQITQFNNKFTELTYPYWEISFKPKAVEKDKHAIKAKKEVVSDNQEGTETHQPTTQPED